MKKPETPENESARLVALERYGVLDTEPEPAFDALTKIAAHIADVPTALVSLVDADRQWFKSRYGLDAPETPRDVSFCGHVVSDGAPLLVEDAWTDERFADNPLVIGGPKVRFYAGSPLTTPDGHTLGTLCVIDQNPNALSEDQLEMLDLLAKQVVDQLELRRRNLNLRHFANVVATSSDAIVTKRLDGTIQSWNRTAEELLGYSADEVIGENVLMLFPPDRLREEYKLIERIKSGEIVEHFETVRLHKDGTPIDVSVSLSPLYGDDGLLFGASKIIRDITTRKRLDRMKEEFVSTVSHELRTPLTSIRGALGLVAGGITGELPAEAQEYVEMAMRNSDRLGRLINDILDIERMESGKLDFRFASHSLQKLLERALADNQGFARTHETSFEIVTPVPQVEIVVDEDRVAQVFANLLSNAAKFTNADSQIHISASIVGNSVRIGVRDFGPGVPEEFRSRIFERFTQADSSDTRAKGGSGLGLAIARTIVDRMHGRLDFDDADGGGTEFYFEFPYYSQPDEDASDRSRVLVCEDDPDVSQLLGDMLQGRGYLVNRTATIERAKRLLMAQDYEAITLDLSLADGPGTELLEWIRSEHRTPDIPIVVVSGALETGDTGVLVSDVIEKPVEADRLFRALSRAVESRPRPRILHVEDEPDLHRIMRRSFPDDWEVDSATTFGQAFERLQTKSYDVVILDLDLPDGRGEQLLSLVKSAEVIIFSAYTTTPQVSDRVAAAMVKSQADPDHLLQSVVDLLRSRD